MNDDLKAGAEALAAIRREGPGNQISVEEAAAVLDELGRLAKFRIEALLDVRRELLTQQRGTPPVDTSAPPHPFLDDALAALREREPVEIEYTDGVMNQRRVVTRIVFLPRERDALRQHIDRLEARVAELEELLEAEGFYWGWEADRAD